MPRTCRPIEGPDPPAAVVSAGSLVQHIIGPVADPFQLACGENRGACMDGPRARRGDVQRRGHLQACIRPLCAALGGRGP